MKSGHLELRFSVYGIKLFMTGRIAQSVTCLTADPGVASSILACSHTFTEIDHEIINSMAILLPSAKSRRGVASYKQKYVHEVQVNFLVKEGKGAKIRNRYNQVSHLTQHTNGKTTNS